MTLDIIRGNALALPLADNTVDLVVTSPPYFGLRSYQDDGEHYAGQLGSEATPAEFVDALLAATAEMVRVLKPSGSIWVNLGDKYAQDQERSRNGNGNRQAIDNFVSGSVLREPTVTLGRRDNGVPRKSLIGIPWRYALRCIDDLGLILRAEIIWSKPNGLPESVTDRVRRSHEQWFHFTVRPRYYSAVDEIREAHADRRDLRGAKDRIGCEWTRDASGLTRQWEPEGQREYNPLGKLPGSVWTVPTQPLTVPAHLGVDHFAAFPMEWPRRIIRGWSPPGVCTGCGEGRRPVTYTDYEHINDTTNAKTLRGALLHLGQRKQPAGEVSRKSVTVTGYACACTDSVGAERTCRGEDLVATVESSRRLTSSAVPEPGHGTTPLSTPPLPPTTPAVVLDPFGGTGTTALVAHALGRHGISVDMSADYCRLAQWRCNDRGQLAAAMQVDKPAAVAEDQLDLFGAG